MRIPEIVESWNTGKNLLLENSILVPEVDAAFKDWCSQTKANSNWMLIGGIVVGFYTRPRTTTDVDVIFRSDAEIPSAVKGFRRNRPHAFMHLGTHVEIETCTPNSINISSALYDEVLADSMVVSGVRIPSASGLVALKITRSSFQDIADIDNICKNNAVDIKKFTALSQNEIATAELKLGTKF